MSYVKYAWGLLLAAGVAVTEAKVFTDDFFPYRVVCPATWEMVEENDSLLVLQDLTPGKKIQLQLRRYPIDTAHISDTTNWSRINYVVNHDMANGVGDVMWDDTGKGVTLGDLRAFELFAYYTQKVGDASVRWAEYCRWTERDNFGYLAAIVGDTLDLLQNLTDENSSYRAVMDSVVIMKRSSTGIVYSSGRVLQRGKSFDGGAVWYNLLGRRVLAPPANQSALLLRKQGAAVILRRSSDR